MYSFCQGSNFKCDTDESENITDEESNENEDEIDSDIEAALYSQIHHLENPSYEPTIEDTNSSQAKDNSDEKDQSLNSTLNENKVTLPSAIIISDDSDYYNVDAVKSNDVEFLYETKSKKKFNNTNSYQKKWWDKFVSDTYDDDDIGDGFLDDENVETNHRNKLSTKSRHTVDLECRHLAFSCKKNKTKKLSLQTKNNVSIHKSESGSLTSFKNNEIKQSTTSARDNATAQPSKRKRSGSTSSEDNAFKHMKHRTEGKDILINVKPSVVTVDLTKGDDELWHISSQDIYNNNNKEARRYYNKQMRTICNNCSERGHISRNCKSPRKLPVCYICAEIGHEAANCLNPACTRCLAVGHSSTQCQWSNSTVERCPICNMWDHLKEECPDWWRRYHMTTTPGPIVCRNTSRNKTVFCYNCARQGHFGHECNMERMDRYTFPTSPFISHYSEPETKFVDFTTSNKRAKIKARFKNLAKKKEKCIIQANKEFERKRRFLQKKADRLMSLALSPSPIKYKKPKQDKKKPLSRGSTINETSLSFASSSQETSNVSELTSKFCIPLKKKRRRVRKKANLLPQSIVQEVKETKKCNKKKMKKMQKALAKSEVIQGNNVRTSNNNSANTVANILRRLVPEVSFSMACMKLFSGKS